MCTGLIWLRIRTNRPTYLFRRNEKVVECKRSFGKVASWSLEIRTEFSAKNEGGKKTPGRPHLDGKKVLHWILNNVRGCGMTRGGGVNSVKKLGLSQTVGEFLAS